MKPRDYQVAAKTGIFKAWEEFCSTLLVLPTGCGKTVVFADVIGSVHPKRAMVIAHREELIWQARDKINKVTGLECGVEMADKFVNNSLFGDTPVIVSTVQTQNSSNGDRKRMGRFNPKDFGVLIIDEAHHATADSYKNLINYYKVNNPEIKILGVTATPDRSDEEALGQVFESVAFDYEILDAIHDGWLVPIEQQFVTINGLDFSNMRTTAGDLNGSDLAEVMENEKNLQGVAGATIEIAGNRRCIVFTASVKQAEDLSNIFNRHRPNMSSWVCGKTPKDDRRAILDQFQKGNVQIVVNCGVLTEGFDDPGVEVIVMARPTKSRSLYAQMAGRSTRPLPGMVDGLEDKDARKEAILSSTKPSCIAEGELVMTSSGLIPIEDVTSDMKVWDGIEFVTNSGVVCQGTREIIEYAGLRATADHKVWTAKGWRTFGDCASEQATIAVGELGGKEIREADGCYRRGSEKSVRKEVSNDNDSLRLWERSNEGIHQPDQWESRMQRVRSSKQAKKMSSMAAVSLSVSQAAMHGCKLPIILSLWREGNSVQVRECRCNGCMDSGEPWTQAGPDDRSNGQQWSLRSWQPSLGKSFVSGQELEHVRVYDIINCGPRNRFVVSGLIVSNCLIIDFVGNSGRHKLMTSADILGGKVSDEAIEKAIKIAQKLGTPVKMSELLDDEEDKIQEHIKAMRLKYEARKAKLVAKVKYNQRQINPFDAFQLSPEKARGWDAGRTLSDKQKSLLLKQGVNPDEMPYAQAKQLLNEMFRRFAGKLCTMKQANALQKYGYETHNMTMKRASELLDALARNGWKKPATPVAVSAPVAAPAPSSADASYDNEDSPFT